MTSPQQQQQQSPPPTISTRSQQKADASKSFLEQHYMGMLRSMAGGQEARPVNQPREKEMGPSDFTILKLIGRGAFGEVFIVRMKDDPDPEKLYAMKRMVKSEMLKKRKVTHVRSENNIMAHAGRESPWIVTLHYSFQDDKYLYMIMDYMPGGDMMTWLCNEGTFSVEATRFYIAELAMAVHSVHECEYVHRDIKPDNILMDAAGHTKLSDFGLCKAFPKSGDCIVDLYSALEQEMGPQQRGTGILSASAPAPFSESEPFDPREPNPTSTTNSVTLSGSPSGSITETPGVDRPSAGSESPSPTSRAQRRVQFNSIVGSPGYIAPEILNRQPYTTACDWWSVGVIMYEMLYGRTPFYNPDPQKTGHMIVHWQEYLRFPPGRGVPESAVDLMKRLLCAQDERISMEGIREHSFFAGVPWDKLQETTPAFCPVLSDPLDTRYFPPNEELVRPPQEPTTGQDPLQQEDPRGVLFADFRFDKRKASSRRSTST